MRRLLLNASPRGKASNSRLLISWIMEGFASAGTAAPEVLDLMPLDTRQACMDAFLAADEAVIVFPLYGDSTPGILKRFIDGIAEADQSRVRGKRLGFLVHSGFPESIQSEPVAAYLERLSERLGCVYLGTAIKPGSEGMRMMTTGMNKKTSDACARLGASLSRGEGFDPAAVTTLAGMRKMGFAARAVFGLMSLTGVSNMYWNMKLRKFGAWDRRFDAPYGKAFRG